MEMECVDGWLWVYVYRGMCVCVYVAHILVRKGKILPTLD